MRWAGKATTSLKSDYVGTLCANMEAPQIVDGSLRVINVLGGWFEGPRIKGKILGPAGDWLRTMPSGVNRVDVRKTIQTSDGELIFCSYNGVMQLPKNSFDRLLKGELLNADDCYFFIAPTFETNSEKHGWLNPLQFAGKMIELNLGEGAHVSYDIFALK